MNYEKLKKDIMTQEYAKQITSWVYEGEYSAYNLPSYDECKEKKYGITNEDKASNYTVYLLGDEVVFYNNIKILDNNKLYVGVGLKPEYCGKKHSHYFLNDSIKDIKEKYSEYTLFLEVRSWNKRAIKSYENIGFKITNIMVSKDRLGNDTEFIEMEM